MGVTFKLIKKIGTVKKNDKAEMKLQLVSWNGEEPVYDLRSWLSDGKAKPGVTFSKDELVRLADLIKNRNAGDNSEDVDIEDLFNSDEPPINKPVEEPQVEEKPKVTEKAKVEKTKTETKSTEKAETNTNYSYEDCEEKLDKLFEKVSKLPNFAYVFEGLKELAKVDGDFVQNVMRESRNFKGMMGYAKDNSKRFCEVIEGGTCITDDQMLELCIEYFNAKEDGKQVAKTETKTASKTKAKKSTAKPKAKLEKVTNIADGIDEELPFN